MFREGDQINIVTVGTGKTRKEAIADCRNDLEEGMASFIGERVEEELDVEVINVKRVAFQ